MSDTGQRQRGSGALPAAASTPRADTARLERQLAVAQQITHIGSWEWDLATNVVSWSDELYRIYGLPPQSVAITLETFLGRLHPEDRERVHGEVTQALQRGGRFAYPERIVRPDGSVRDLDTVGEVVRDAEGRTTGMIGTCRDVTEERARDAKIRLYAEIVQGVQIGLCVFRVKDPDDPAGITLLASNPAGEAATGVRIEGNQGARILDLMPSLADTEVLALLTGVARDRAVREIAAHRFPPGSGSTYQTFSLKAFPLHDHCVGLALEDVTSQTRARELLAVEQRVLEMVAAGASLEDTLTTLVLAIEAQSPGTMASVLRLSADGQRIRHAAAPHLPDGYNRAIDGLPIGPHAGSCGTSAYRRTPVYVGDIETDPLWEDYRELAQTYGLRACWSVPILAADERVLGTFAMYYHEPRLPSPADLELIGRATHVAGIAVQRKVLDDQLRALSAHIETAREEERREIAREIHDALGQELTAIKMDLAWITRRCDSGAELDRDALREKLRAMVEITDGVIRTIRETSANLRPGALDDLGLLAAIEWQVHEFESRTGIPCVVLENLGDTPLDKNLATAVFRVFQEALTNVARHAQANRVEVRLSRTPSELNLEVRDDGVGITPEAAHNPNALGLLGIRERARRLGGRAEIHGKPNVGTTVFLTVPLAGFRRVTP